MDLTALQKWITGNDGCNADESLNVLSSSISSAFPLPVRGEAPHDIAHHEALLKVFPGALPATAFVAHAIELLHQKGMTCENTILGTSFCVDEVNRNIESSFANSFSTQYFNLGGLSGFPFAGAVGINTMKSHIPEGG